MNTSSDPLRSARAAIRIHTGDSGLTRRFALAYALTVTPLGITMLACYFVGGWGFLVVGFLVAGFTQNALGILMHEASHTFVHPDRRLNDLLADFLVSMPLFNTTQGYRSPHMAHHRHAGSRADPHFGLYGLYTSHWQFVIHLLRDLCGLTVVTHFTNRYLSSNTLGQQPRYAFPGLALVQAVLFGSCWLATGWWWAYMVLWFLPLCTIPHAVNRIRTFVEHQPGEGGAPANRSTVPTWMEWLLIAPYGYSYHHEHHLLLNVPYFRLSNAHHSLVQMDYSFTPTELAPHGYLRAFWQLWRTLGKVQPSEHLALLDTHRQRAG